MRNTVSLMIKEFAIGFSRTINLGNYESARVEASVTYIVDEREDGKTEEMFAQQELRRLLEETWKAQYEFTTQRMKK